MAAPNASPTLWLKQDHESSSGAESKGLVPAMFSRLQRATPLGPIRCLMLVKHAVVRRGPRDAPA